MRRIKQLWAASLITVVFCACSSEQDEIILPSVSTDRAIEFTFAFPGDEQEVATRAKTSFTKNDSVYVTAEVTLTDRSTKVMSTILRYNGSRWAADGAVPTWPKNSLKATFTAYLLPPAFTLSMDKGSNLVIPLSSFKEATDDPFMARVKDVPVNGIVPLQFAHTTTKLYVTGLKHGVTEKVRFYNADPEFKMNNQVVFTYSPEKGFTHEFTHDESIQYIEQEIEKTASRVTFFLDVEPDVWKDHIEFRLDQVTETGNYGTAENPVNVKTTSLSDRTGLLTMQRGRAYSMYFLDGQTNGAFIEEEKWYAEPAGAKVFTSKDEIQEYFTDVLSNGSLTEDLDFNFIDLDGLSLRSSLSTKGITLNNSLNGNFHTIKNIRVMNGLFNEIPSGVTIQNLRLENVKVEASGTDEAGLLAPVNYGTIRNVRISGNNSIGANNVSCVGGMVGVNSGTITNSQIEGTLVMECYREGLTVGGFVGDNSGDITGSAVISASIISATVPGSGASVGGFAGVNGGSIRSSSTNMLVDASRVKGSGISHTGGFVGDNSGTLISCEATGDVKGGASDGTVRIGGFAGYINGEVNKCYATGYVYEKSAISGAQIGGFAGFSLVDLTNCSSTGKLSLASGHSGRDVGALVGLLNSTSTIYNSFSVSTTSIGDELGFAGKESAQVYNCHYGGFMLDAATGAKTGTPASAALLNNGRGTYSEWTSNSSYFNGAPYLMK